MEANIQVTGLRKRFGAQQALDGMTFTVQPGRVTGFVGPNGAGKSTTMRVILGLDTADEGTALVGGKPYAALRTPLSHVGALLDAGVFSRAAVPAATCCGSPTPRASAPGASARSSSRLAFGLSRGARQVATRWVCASGSASPRRCSATRRS